MKTPYLVGHFIRNIWAAPWQDNQSIIRPDRITPFGGARNYVRIFREEYNLPTKQDRYHAYHIGQVSEHILNLPFYEWVDKSKWLNVAEYCKESNVLFQFYTKKGIVIPLSNVFFTVTLEKNLVFVIRETPQLKWDMNTEDVTFRTYRNAFFNVNVINKPAEKLDIIYQKVELNTDKTVLFTFYQKYNSLPGKVFTYVNGNIVNDPISYPILEGDVVEMIYDSTITKMIEIKINQLPTFKSILDGIRKYLFTHDKTYRSNIFEYFDDCDFYLSAYPLKTPKLYKGVMLHRNDITNVRQVTNCDFSISSNLVQEMMLDHDYINSDTANLVFQVYYRKQATVKRMPFVHHRLHDLNKLPYANRVAAFMGVRSNVDEWRAEVLENSALMKAMSLDKPNCDLETIQNIYGYNGATWYTAKSLHPSKDFIKDGQYRYVNIPYSFRPYCTVFEYNAEGVMGMYMVLKDYRQYRISHPDTEYVEFIGAVGTEQPYHYRGSANQDFKVGLEDAEYRVYAISNDLLQANSSSDVSLWQDVTDKVDVTDRVDNQNRKFQRILQKPKSSINPDPITVIDKQFVLRNDRDFLLSHQTLRPSDRIWKFRLNQSYWNADQEEVQTTAVPLPYGYLDVFLDGKALIEGIDYYVIFPMVYIINKTVIGKEYNNPNDPAHQLTYRMYGFPDTKQEDNRSYLTGIMNANRQVGYVNNSMLSRNKRYDILDDKNLLIKIGNGIIAKEDLGFTENGNIIAKRKDILEGKPYEIVDIVSGKRDAYPKDTYQFKKEAEILDKKISDYMSQFIKDKSFPSNPPIQGLYKVYSPLLSKLIDDLIMNQIKFDKMEGRYLDEEVMTLIEARYRDFFQIDPYFRMDLISKKHCTIHPTWRNTIVTMGYHPMRFLRQVIRIYYRNEIEISHFVRVGE